MAMTVAHNSASAMALNELNKNRNRLSKDLKKVSSGVRITGAEDGASEYSITEKMKTLIRSLGQDRQNTSNAKSLLQVADGGIANIIDELRSLKELALNSANDHNTDFDRSILQKEFEQRCTNIDDIAATTNYNGKILLDGRYKRVMSNSTSEVFDIPNGDYTISHNGAYRFPPGYSGTLTIIASDVELQQSNTDALRNVHIKGNSSGNLNLWLNNIRIDNEYQDPSGYPSYYSVVKFNGSNNTLNLIGSNSINNASPPGVGASAGGATVSIGEELTIREGADGGNLDIYSMPPAIGQDATESPKGNLIINSGNISAKSDFFSSAAIGGEMKDITINGGTVFADSVTYTGGSSEGAAIGSSMGRHVGVITINTHASIQTLAGNGQQIGAGGLGGTCDGVIYTDEIFHDTVDYTRPGASSSSNEIGKPLTFQTGAKANQQIKCYINNMHIDAMGLDKAGVTPQELAIRSINMIDDAIEYALNEATNIGAYISRLEYAENNIVLSQENVMASESTIRDADMAKEMMSYTKNSILSQSAQAMLAQANQNASSVLILLQ